MEKERKEVLKYFEKDTASFKFTLHIIRISKQTEFSKNVREQGNEIFRLKLHPESSHDQILEHYTNSICIAENNSDGLSFAYGNRAALLLHISQYEPCIIDIDRALSLTCDPCFSIKLLLRKAKCLHALESEKAQSVVKEAKSLLKRVSKKAQKKTLGEDIDKTKVLLSKPLKQKAPSMDHRPEMLRALHEVHETNDFSSVKVQYNSMYGRHLVATKDFKPGQVIFVEEPAVKFLNLKKLYGYCSHCLARSWANFPCDKCAWTTYCSKKCQEEAWKQYHSLDCSVYPGSKFMSNLCETLTKQLAIKALILGLKEYGTVDKLRTELKAFDKFDDHLKGFVENGDIKTNGFKTIYALTSNISNKTTFDHVGAVPLLLKSLATYTSIIGTNFDIREISNYKKNEDALYLGSLFLRISKISELNGRQMWNYTNKCRNKSDSVQCLNDECCSIGAYIAPITSLINHSCDPNVGRCYTSDHKVVVYTLKPIAKGDQIFDCYIKASHDEKISEWHKVLSTTYNTNCNCDVCPLKKPQRPDMSLMPTLPLSSILQDKTEYDKDTIVNLSKSIRKVMKKSPTSSSTIWSLINSLRITFDYLYGISLDIPTECNKI